MATFSQPTARKAFLSVNNSQAPAGPGWDVEDALTSLETLLLQHLSRGAQGGVLPAMAQSCLHSGGKRMRARLALSACQALGVGRASACAWASACELMHQATLVHDDLQDGDTTRRGRPTAWVTYGSAQAINVGDWLFMSAFTALNDLPPAEAQACGFWLTQALAAGMADVIEGQGLECASADYKTRIASFPYLAMVRGKTAALFALPVQGAALLAGHDLAAAAQLAAPFLDLGTVFQLQDDVLDLWGDKGRNAPGADLREGKLSALVVTHLKHWPADAAWLGAILDKPRAQTQVNEVRRAIDAFASQGTLRHVLAQMDALGTTAQAQVTPALAPVFNELLQRTWQPLQGIREAQMMVPEERHRGDDVHHDG